MSRWTALVAALLILNASLSFQNLWPTPAITWLTTIAGVADAASRRPSANRPAARTSMPTDASAREPIRSEAQPLAIATLAMLIGLATITSPAWPAVQPRAAIR